MSVDRTQGPPINKVTSLSIPPASRTILENGIELIEVNMGTQSLVQLEVLFKGGRVTEAQKGASRAVARLLKEGTASYSGSEIAEKVDFYGANLSSGASLDYSYVKIFALTKYFNKILPIMEEVLYKPTFPQAELDKYKTNCIQKLKVEMAKSELVAYKKVTEEIYGVDHVYGYNSTDEIYRSLTRDALQEYYDASYGTSNCIVILSGDVTDEVRNSVVAVFGSRTLKHVAIEYQKATNTPNTEIVHKYKSEDDLQTAVKIGMKLFKRSHPDFADMFILNTILGGYFGSRLMSSLREEKGYTYNIYSSIDMMMYDGYFNISTEVGNQYLEATLEGIFAEVDKLKTELINETELDMVKNYLSGNFLNMIDGPFKVAGMSKVVALNGLDFGFYEDLMARIHSISAADLLALANKYLNRKEMVTVLVGNH